MREASPGHQTPPRLQLQDSSVKGGVAAHFFSLFWSLLASGSAQGALKDSLSTLVCGDVLNCWFFFIAIANCGTLKAMWQQEICHGHLLISVPVFKPFLKLCWCQYPHFIVGKMRHRSLLRSWARSNNRIGIKLSESQWYQINSTQSSWFRWKMLVYFIDLHNHLWPWCCRTDDAITTS